MNNQGGKEEWEELQFQSIVLEKLKFSSTSGTSHAFISTQKWSEKDATKECVSVCKPVCHSGIQPIIFGRTGD